MFTPSEIGFWERESTYKVAQALREPVNMAGAYILRTRELWVLHSERGRLPAEYDAFAIARRADFKGPPRKLIKALTDAKLLRFRRGRYEIPGFAATEAGRYSEYREWDRNRQRDRRRKMAEAEDASTGRPVDAPVDVLRRSESKVESGDAAPQSPPGAPPLGGGVSGSALWDWFRVTYPRLRNLKRTRELLEQTCSESEAVEAQLRYCLGVQAPKYVSLMRKGKAHWVPWSDVWLSKGNFWEHRPPKPKAAPPPPDPVEQALLRRQEEERQQQADQAHRELVQYGDIKRQLQLDGYRGAELVQLADARLEEWRQQQQGEQGSEDEPCSCGDAGCPECENRAAAAASANGAHP